MIITNFILDRSGRVRSGWRVATYILIYLLAAIVLAASFNRCLRLLGLLNIDLAAHPFARCGVALIQAFPALSSALIAGWTCGALYESLPFAALGWNLHKGWFRNFLIGCAVGAASVTATAIAAILAGGLRLTLDSFPFSSSTFTTVFTSGLIFIAYAASEETLFRGYPLQTMLRSWPPWIGISLMAILFAALHLFNPNVQPIYTFLNTALAGIWLALAYWRTRSLWLSFGLHWSWNWTLGALLGIPVSGISNFADHPLLHVARGGETWVTGGRYGLEGGAACAAILVGSIAFIARSPALKRSGEAAVTKSR